MPAAAVDGDAEPDAPRWAVCGAGPHVWRGADAREEVRVQFLAPDLRPVFVDAIFDVDPARGPVLSWRHRRSVLRSPSGQVLVEEDGERRTLYLLDGTRLGVADPGRHQDELDLGAMRRLREDERTDGVIPCPPGYLRTLGGPRPSALGQPRGGVEVLTGFTLGCRFAGDDRDLNDDEDALRVVELDLEGRVFVAEERGPPREGGGARRSRRVWWPNGRLRFMGTLPVAAARAPPVGDVECWGPEGEPRSCLEDEQVRAALVSVPLEVTLPPSPWAFVECEGLPPGYPLAPGGGPGRREPPASP